MAVLTNVQDFKVWQESRNLVKEVYLLTKKQPFAQDRGLVDQVRPSAVSIPSNIAEGFGRGSRKDFLRFLYIARGSLFELETQLILAMDVGYISENENLRLQGMIVPCSKMLGGLIRKLGKEPNNDQVNEEAAPYNEKVTNISNDLELLNPLGTNY